MPHLPSLPADATLMQVFRAFPETSRPLIAYHEIVMNGPSPFTTGERELIAAFVSGVNACAYCHGVHTRVAQEYGVPEGVLADALADLDATDLDAAGVDERLKPVLRYVRVLTETPAQVTAADADAVYAAGWDETALHHAVMVCGLFNLMNRMVDGHGITAGPEYYAESGRRLREVGYRGLLPLIDA